jgi:hypothetical protein
MARFFIEVPHGDETVECARAVQVFLNTGSHFLTNAEWGCEDGEHKAWLTVDVENKEAAFRILPPVFRPQAKIVKLSTFKQQDIDRVLREHMV